MITRERRAADAYEINDVLARYCRSYDRADADLMRSCFHETAQFSYDGGVQSRNDFVKSVIERTVRYETAMHFIGNVSIDFTSDDTARAETYVIAYHLGVDRDSPATNRTLGARYVDQLRRGTDGEWRIDFRAVVFDWVRADHLEPPTESPRGQRSRQDLSYVPG